MSAEQFQDILEDLTGFEPDELEAFLEENSGLAIDQRAGAKSWTITFVTMSIHC